MFLCEFPCPSQLCLAYASPWFTNISKFSSICNCEFVVHVYIYIHTYIAHQGSNFRLWILAK